jgi:hypothetical protein
MNPLYQSESPESCTPARIDGSSAGDPSHQGHGAKIEPPQLRSLPPGTVGQLEQLLPRQVRVDGVAEVAVGLAIAGNPPPEPRQGVTEVELIGSAHQPMRRT